MAIIFHHIGPYHHARLRAASRIFRVTGIEWSAQGSYAWGARSGDGGYRTTSLFETADKGSRSKGDLYKRVHSALKRLSPDVVFVNGWGDFGAIQTLRALCESKVPAVAMSESTARDEPRFFFKEAIKGRIAKLYAAALVGGAPQARYAAALGFAPESVFVGYDAIDNTYFAKGAADRRRAGSPPAPAPYFLASSRFIARKNLQRLLSAYARYRAKSANPWDLVLLGDGLLKRELEAQAARLRLSNALHMPGFVQYNALPDYYAFAGAFIHASTSEQWGLVVNEAMASGLPVIVSDRCGCCEDLVDHGVNGFSFDPFDEEELAALMVCMASNERDRQAMGIASRRRIEKLGPQAFAEGLKKAVAFALEAPRGRVSLADTALLRVLSWR